MEKFIRTTHEPTAKELESLGFQKIQDSDGVYVFMNSNKILFSENVDVSKIQYTSMLMF